MRKRQGGVANIEAKVTDDLTLNVNAFYSRLKADNYNRNYMMWASQFVNSQTPTSYTVQNGVLTSATYAPVTGGTTVTDGTLRLGGLSALGGNTGFNGALTVNGGVLDLPVERVGAEGAS